MKASTCIFHLSQTVFSGTLFQRMSLPSPSWSQKETAPCTGTLAALLPASSSDSDSGCALEDYSGPTTEIPPAEALPHFGSYPSDAGPSAVQTWLRVKTLLQQLPPQDCDERYCQSIGEEERKQLRTFAVRRWQESLGQGIMCLVPSTLHGFFCKKCGKRMNSNERGVFAPKLGEECCWHPACFVCRTCHQSLVDLIYFHQNGKIYCGRHHAEFFRPRCASCDQLIFTSECMEAEGMRWHEEHFCCLECDLPLGARRYVMKGGQPCCCACFESLYADICQACGEIIGVDSEQATLQGQHWHAKAACFCCSLCQKALLGQLVTIHNGRLFCSEVCSLEKESALSSTGSDSSDSAFISAPSPDSTPTSRTRIISPSCSSTGARTNSDACEQRAEADAMERFHTTGNSSLCTEISNQEEKEVCRNRAISPQLNKLGLLADSSQEDKGASGPHPLEADQSTFGMNKHQIIGTSLQKTSQQQVGDHCFSSLSATPNTPVLTMNFPERLYKGGTGEQEPTAEQDDNWCPTCSSSSDSDSEPEGFFFGKPIPKPGSRCITPHSLEQQTVRARASSKQCNVS
ncbi:prickle-like protein 4 isoform X2 [Hemicordylus capensis]|uniref:prickle-like protein 4 isoform X2 n=1 Tax=Hemicordylus capensis TaxID=884348 RepID=UPI0023022019|nr:prickle-like protein 4 isoform X2 [Hemicordylus capensis]